MVYMLRQNPAPELATLGEHRNMEAESQSQNWQVDRVGTARLGTNPTVLRRMSTGWAVIGDYQRLPGYCVLLYDGTADQLLDLPRTDQLTFLADLATLGEAVAAACSSLDQAFSRINYEILGNAFHHLHGHIRARYGWEPDELRRGPIWRYPDLTDEAYRLSERHDDLREAITGELDRLLDRNDEFHAATPGDRSD